MISWKISKYLIEGTNFFVQNVRSSILNGKFNHYINHLYLFDRANSSNLFLFVFLFIRLGSQKPCIRSLINFLYLSARYPKNLNQNPNRTNIIRKHMVMFTAGHAACFRAVACTPRGSFQNIITDRPRDLFITWCIKCLTSVLTESTLCSINRIPSSTAWAELLYALIISFVGVWESTFWLFIFYFLIFWSEYSLNLVKCLNDMCIMHFTTW